jgi:NADP-dependent 3-hydroxy acid dehydrogenase YdfG
VADGAPTTTLVGRRVLVAGASTGLGAALVGICAGAGAAVGAIARASDALDEVARSTGAIAAPADLRDPAGAADAVARVAAALRGLDALVITAGVMLHSAIGDGRTDDWDEIYSANVLGTLHVAHAALPHLREAECGDLVIVSSTSADRVTAADYGVYASTKAAQSRIAEALRVELAASAPNVRVTLVKPGFMNTPGLGKGTRNPEVRERIVALKERIGLPPVVVAAEIRHLLELPPEVTVPEVTIVPTARA